MIGRSMIGRQEYNAGIAPVSRESHSGASWGGRPVVNLLGDDLRLPPALDAPRYDRSERGQAANRGISVHGGFWGAVVLREIARQGEGDGAPRGVPTRLRTYSLTDGSADWLLSRQLDTLPKGQQKWVEENDLYLFSTHKEEWARNREKHRHLNDQGGRPVANIVERNSGPRPKDAPPEQAGGILRQTYPCKEAMCIATSAFLQEWGLYNGAIGKAFDIVARAGSARRRRPPPSSLRGPRNIAALFISLATRKSPLLRQSIVYSTAGAVAPGS